MLILAIDTALDACAAAVLDTGANQILAQESQAMKRGHAEALMPLIARVMKASGIAFAALERVAATTGPGSFTGLRVGLSAARGIALAAGKPVVGLTTLAAYAAPIVAENGEHPIMAAIDARHDHVYFQMVTGDGSPLIKPQVAPICGSARRLALRHAASRRQCGADPGRSLASRCTVAVHDRPAAGARHRLGGMAGGRGQSRGSSPARPFYLRAPDAKPPKDLLSKDPLSKDPLAKDPLAEAAQPSAS